MNLEIPPSKLCESAAKKTGTHICKPCETVVKLNAQTGDSAVLFAVLGARVTDSTALALDARMSDSAALFAVLGARIIDSAALLQCWMRE